MKRGREEEKISSPLFPRLHVNDADKGGPRAPPRNKMALYEQFSIPSQRFTSTSSSVTFSSRHGSSSISASQGCEQERSSSSSLYVRPQIRPLSAEKSQSCTTEAMPRVTSKARQTPAEKSEEDFRVPVYVQIANEDGHMADKRSKNFKKNGSNLGDHSDMVITLPDASSDQDHDDENLGSSDDVEKSGSSGSMDKIHSSEDGTMDRTLENDASERLIVDSGEGMDAYNPDNLVGLIGLKHFWKARRAILSQQRIFVSQVFELHRLTNVQKLLAESPHLLLEDVSSFHGSSAAPPKSQPADLSVKPVDPKVNETRAAERKEVSLPEEESRVCKAAPPVPPPGPVTSDSKAGPWPIQVAGNHWLLPVMSPTEGLVYKPFYKPENMVLLPPPYCLPPPGPPLSGSVVEQASFFSGSQVSYSNRPNPRDANLQSSTASSTTSWPKPVAAATIAGESPVRVIKVVPRNPKSASESAVKIFQSIQMERQRYDVL